jgi:hypothetical protein
MDVVVLPVKVSGGTKVLHDDTKIHDGHEACFYEDIVSIVFFEAS